jgi:hypothetical protein
MNDTPEINPDLDNLKNVARNEYDISAEKGLVPAEPVKQHRVGQLSIVDFPLVKGMNVGIVTSDNGGNFAVLPAVFKVKLVRPDGKIVLKALTPRS